MGLCGGSVARDIQNELSIVSFVNWEIREKNNETVSMVCKSDLDIKSELSVFSQVNRQIKNEKLSLEWKSDLQSVGNNSINPSSIKSGERFTRFSKQPSPNEYLGIEESDMKNTESVVYPRRVSNASTKSMSVMISLGSDLHENQEDDSNKETWNVIESNSDTSVKETSGRNFTVNRLNNDTITVLQPSTKTKGYRTIESFTKCPYTKDSIEDSFNTADFSKCNGRSDSSETSKYIIRNVLSDDVTEPEKVVSWDKEIFLIAEISPTRSKLLSRDKISESCPFIQNKDLRAKKREILDAYLEATPSSRRQLSLVTKAVDEIWAAVTQEKGSRVTLDSESFNKELLWLQSRKSPRSLWNQYQVDNETNEDDKGTTLRKSIRSARSALYKKVGVYSPRESSAKY